MNWLFFAIVSFIGYGVGDIFGTIATRKLGGFSTTLWTLIIGTLLFSLYIPFAWNELEAMSTTLFFQTVGIGILFIVALVAFYQALKIDSSSVVGTIASSFAAVTVVLSIVFLKEQISLPQTLSIVIIFLGVIMSSLELNRLKRDKLTLSKGIILALVAMIFWGIYFTFIKIPVSKIGWFWPTYITYLSFPLMLFFLKFKKMKIKKPTLKSGLMPIIISVILTGSAEFSYNFAISKGQVSLIAPIAGSYPTLFVLLSFIIFRDSITKQQLFGIIITLLGIVLLAFNN